MKRTKVIRINGVEYVFEPSGTGANIDIVDNLETTDVNSALSANQGKVLNDKVELLKSETMVPEYNEETETLKLNFKVPTQGIIEDTLESDNANNALSANQGKILNEKINNVENIIDEINNDLTETSINVLKSTGTNASSIVCKMKNNRVVLNGHLVYHNHVGPNETVTLGTVDSLARPTRATTILVGVLGNDAETQGFTIGTLNVDGTIMVKNSLSISATHFYFDAVWDV